MRISIVTSYFLPVPPLRGGAMEKTWWNLARIWAAQGHDVTVISRSWPGLTDRESSRRLKIIRLRGGSLSRQRWLNLYRDFRWSRRVLRELPPADFVISNSVFLPLWFRSGRQVAGRVVPVIARMPKGQLRHYGEPELVLALSAAVAVRIANEAPRLAGRIQVFPLPLDVARLAAVSARKSGDVLTLGYIGRLHPEKGLELLLLAAAALTKRAGLPAWRLLILGPCEIRDGGGGWEWWRDLCLKFAPQLDDRLQVAGPEFDSHELAKRYGTIDVFCYPSLAEQGETFGAAVAEAMAARCVPVVSALDCFRDLVRDGETGRVFQQSGPDAPERLAEIFAEMLTSPTQRAALAENAFQKVQDLDYPKVASRLAQILESLPSSRIPLGKSS